MLDVTGITIMNLKFIFEHFSYLTILGKLESRQNYLFIEVFSIVHQSSISQFTVTHTHKSFLYASRNTHRVLRVAFKWPLIFWPESYEYRIVFILNTSNYRLKDCGTGVKFLNSQEYG